MRPRTVHIVGAGLAGLAAAAELSGRGLAVLLHEATQAAGGRCRSYADPKLGIELDNGNHLILSGNHATIAYLRAIGAMDAFVVSPTASFPFIDMKTRECWTVRANDGPIPWWILAPSRRVPGVPLGDYAGLARLLFPRAGATIGETISCGGPLYERLLEPFLMSALNIYPREGSAALAAGVIRETLAAGGRHYRPLFARQGLSRAFVDPALDYIRGRGGAIEFSRRLTGVKLEDGRAKGLTFGDVSIELANDDCVILAAPPQVASAMLPGLAAPSTFRAIVNAHYRIAPPTGLAPITGVVHGLAQWLFAFPDRLSVTISAADSLADVSNEDLAERIWRDVAVIANISGPMPPCRILRERRATFAATPKEDAKRPGARTAWANLSLAGDWTQTGLPATIEGAIRSGVTAARHLAPL